MNFPRIANSKYRSSFLVNFGTICLQNQETHQIFINLKKLFVPHILTNSFCTPDEVSGAAGVEWLVRTGMGPQGGEGDLLSCGSSWPPSWGLLLSCRSAALLWTPLHNISLCFVLSNQILYIVGCLQECCMYICTYHFQVNRLDCIKESLQVLSLLINYFIIDILLE